MNECQAKGIAYCRELTEWEVLVDALAQPITEQKIKCRRHRSRVQYGMCGHQIQGDQSQTGNSGCSAPGPSFAKFLDTLELESGGDAAGLSGTQLDCDAMRRRLTTFLLMLCMCWQALAYAGSAVVLADADELVHATMHFEATAHHHDEHGDGDMHLDESQASAQHLMDEACVFAPTLIRIVQLTLPALLPDMPAATIATAAPPPVLDSLERPPRLTA